MADENNGNPGRRQRADDVEQMVGFRLGQRCGRLVHEDKLRFADQRPGNRHDLALGDGIILQRPVDIECHAQPRQGLDRLLAHAVVIDETRPAAEQCLK